MQYINYKFFDLFMKNLNFSETLKKCINLLDVGNLYNKFLQKDVPLLQPGQSSKEQTILYP